MTQSTEPMPLDALAAAPGGLADFRIRSETEIHAWLRRLCETESLLYLNTPQGASCSTTLWAVDGQRGKLSFAIDTSNPQWQRVLEAEEITVVGYLDNVKLQFDLSSLMLVHGANGSALAAVMPRELFRFQRRDSFRVRPAVSRAPTAQFAHPMIPDMPLELRLLDVSVGGCALLLPDNVPPLAPGVRINAVRIALDAATHLRCALVLHHVTAIQPDSRGVRLGCEFASVNSEAARTLQRFVNDAQKRRPLLSLD